VKTLTKRRGCAVLLSLLVILTLLAVGGWAYVTRPQGEAAAVEFTDARLQPALTDARILALGEATHGNAEFQQLRTQLTSKVVDHGFRTVVLEEDYGHTHDVNEFVQGGPGTAQEAAQRFGFAINKTAQVAEWLQWMRDHNASAPAGQRITLVGMDVQRTEPSLRIVADALQSSDPEAAQTASDASKAEALDDATVESLRAAVHRLPASPDRHDAEFAVDALAANIAVTGAGDAYSTTREKAMFTNLRRIVEESKGGVLLFGHNAHVGKTANGAVSEPVGARAAKQWGEGYRVIGTEFVDTTFLSGTKDERREWSLTNRTPLRGMYEGTSIGYLDFAQTSGTNRTLVDSPTMMGSAGESFTYLQKLVPFFHTVSVVPSQMYDALILVEDATPTTML